MRADHAGAILLYDYVAAISFGAAAAIAAWLLVPQSWVGPPVMIGGMVVGVAAVVPLFALFTALLGGFEIIVLSMQVGMLAGMVGAMSAEESAGSVLAIGALIGFGVHTVIRIRDRTLHGEVDLHE